MSTVRPVSLHVARHPSEYDALAAQWGSNERVALVPTMGALHDGHAALIEHARQMADRVVVSIFVNPLQFGPQEDLSRYPRPLDADLARCQNLGVDVVFLPQDDTMYPFGRDNATTVVPPSHLTERLCGAFRPGHFTGVATVVLKLFGIIRPHFAVFGEKDAQQLMIIRRLVQDLNLNLSIIAHPTIREADGLALSSRNRYLQTELDRQTACLLYRILTAIRAEALGSATPLPTQSTINRVCQRFLTEQPSTDKPLRLQYLEAVCRDSFEPANTLDIGRTKLLIAGYVGDVRLIDNLDV